MISINVAGAAGRMGKRIIHIIQQSEEATLAGALEKPKHPAVGKDAGVVAGLGELGIKVVGSLEDVIEEADVLIDFSAPEATLDNIRILAARGMPMVIGTTGFKDEGMEEIKKLSKQMPCVMAPNMSMGVNVMFKIAGEMAKILGRSFDMEILETHHRFKKDAPSGTALRLGGILANAVGRDFEKAGIYERRGNIGERSNHEIGIQTWRAGDITGEHTVMFGGIGERLELTHRAHNRDNFAGGAVRAAIWVVKQPKGLYDMQDVLGLK